jgi:hemolysin activation/secretion protein
MMQPSKLSALRSKSFMRNTALLLPFFGVMALIGGALSDAKAAIEIPSTAQPGQIEKRFEPEVQPVPNTLQLNIPAPVESQQISDAQRAQLEKAKFVLQSLDLEGATVFSPADFTPLYEAKIGQTISLLDAKEIANKITDMYRDKGYILSQAIVPAQTVTDGVLKIRAVEGYISTVVFEGSASDAAEQASLQTYADKISSDRPAQMADIERYMLLMNDMPGATVTGLIRPAQDTVGAADLVLTVHEKKYEGSYQFDNRGSRYIGPWQHTFMLGANSLIDSFDHTQVRVETADPFKELFGIEAEHDEILDSEGTKLSLLGSHTRTQPGGDLSQLNVIGNSDLLEAKLSHPFVRLRQDSVVGRIAFDVHNTTTDVFSNEALATDRLRIARVGGNYSFLDTARGSDSIDVQLSQGMNIFNATSSGDARSNAFGDSAFTKTNFDLSRLQQLPHKLSLLTSATGQYSFDPLLTDEQFSLGGTEYGRAFDPGEVLGDSGIAGKAELRYSDSVGEAYFQTYQLYGFFDVGEVWIRNSPAGASPVSLSSTGVGTRVNFTDYLSSSFEVSVPTIKPNSDATSYRHSPRLFFTLSAHF